ncbi:HAMP domain-containing sensor histidine kinase [Sphingobacterium bovistauri]|uniref:histidine kinase n=1 Tax=Sphingobacterium bovistauri TaxID=2781959 RepID=A0ABS7Z7I3_9SPHI|nr:ATP-binding protein [Sphingobacterium bovistauri]MCA5005552.1 HAMP domain-containing protein [Sphingobacterium bovistauri]
MKIKTKLTFGVGLLFLMILALVIISGWYVNQLRKDTNNILVANYNTLQYSRNMLLSLEDINLNNRNIEIFQKNLDLQQANVTEIGEIEITNLLVKHFNLLKENSKDSAILSTIRKDISELMRLNMEAIDRKSNIADSTAENAIIMISLTGTLCFLIAFILLVNLPSNIANPIKELTDSIKEIAGQNYKKRVHFASHSEFGDLATSFNTMAEKLEEYSESKLDKIIKGKKRIETLIDNMHDPVIGIDEMNKVLFVNNEAVKISGVNRSDLIDQPIQEIALTNDLIKDLIKDINNPENINNTTKTLKIFADNKESYFEKEIIDINIIPTGEQTTNFIGKVILLRNITPFKELDMAKTNFIGTVSHEFKTPISSIEMSVRLLKNERIGKLNEEQKELIIGIEEDTSRLLKITGELLNMTQVESGSIQINQSLDEIRPMLEYAVHANKSAAEQKQILINIDIQDGISSVIMDSEKTAWVLTNLLSNAIRYSHENSSIKIDVHRKNDKILFSISDTGQGIQTEYLDKIFERYFRIPGTKKDGTGLGLSISKEFIEAQGGEIWVESDFGAGSTFYFTLNLPRENYL